MKGIKLKSRQRSPYMVSILSVCLLNILLYSFIMAPVVESGSARIPGDSYYPVLVPFDQKNVHLFFSHEFVERDAVSNVLMHMSLTQGSWSEAAPLTPFSAHCHLQGISSHCHITWTLFSKEITIYLVQVVSGFAGFHLKTYRNGGWSEWELILDESYIERAVQELQIISDSKRQLHMVWEQFHHVELDDGSYYAKQGLLYSTYSGSNASAPESVKGVEYTKDAEICPACARHFLAMDPITDQLYIAWFNGLTFFTTRTPDGWTAPIQVDTTPYSTNLTHEGGHSLADLPLLAFKTDSKGALYFFFSVVPENKRLLLIKYEDVKFTQFKSDQPAPFRLVRDYPVQLFDVERDSTDMFHLAYIRPDSTGATKLYYQTFKDGFSSPVLISEFAGEDLDLAIDTQDTPHIAWTRQLGAKEIFYTYRTEVGWVEPTQVTNASVLGFTWPLVTQTVPELPLTPWIMLLPWGILAIYVQHKKKASGNRQR